MKIKKVKVYSTTTCPYCRMEKSWLEAKEVKHEVVYVDKDQSEAVNMVQKTGQMGVPVTEIEFNEGDSKYIVGFDIPSLTEALDINN